ncbi:SEC-C metal-binding domain-containing protein [Marinivivus vitaminiproducens]|uniref:SEC-C metal-binding domain-containing protein n=1 Tax=Marinivivus vitaminiproducens TaxID=3035935 RepID=UPI003FA08775
MKPGRVVDLVESPGAPRKAATILIAPCVIVLNTWRLRRGLGSPVPDLAAAARKIGRNAPCPCGSGTKYKKCCDLS